MKKITPCLWFDDQAEEAVALYTSLFPNSRVVTVTHYGEGGYKPEGTVLTMIFELDGQEFMALNGGPDHRLTPAYSMFVHCETQAEVDELWQKLSEGGEEIQCGWLNDRFGLAWQIVPNALGEMLRDPDPEKVKRVTQAMLQMVKLDIAGLRRAYEQA